MLLLLIFCCFAFCFAGQYLEEWENFKVVHKKSYNSTEEENRRKQAFFENMDFIVKHNIDYKNGLTTTEVGMNQYGDLTQKEFERIMLGIGENDELGSSEDESSEDTPSFFKALMMKGAEMRKLKTTFSVVVDLLWKAYDQVVNEVKELANDLETRTWPAVNRSVDWAKVGAVTPAKDQGFCGSCWAFSAVGALESHLFIKTGKLEPLSVQHLIDCIPYPSNHSGCSGGLMDESFSYVIKNGGIASEKSYPYEEKSSECRYKNEMSAGTCREYAEIFGWNLENAMKYILSKRGPICIVMDASSIQFRFYKRGIYESSICHESNHAVLLVGFNQTEEPGYWSIKNSWGPTWGENGFARISMARPCGMNQYFVYPVV